MIFCDNEASVQVLNTGHSRDSFMQKCLREICYVASVFQFHVRARHIEGVSNRLADCLSHWDLDNKYQQNFINLTNSAYKEVFIDESFCLFICDW